LDDQYGGGTRAAIHLRVFLVVLGGIGASIADTGMESVTEAWRAGSQICHTSAIRHCYGSRGARLLPPPAQGAPDVERGAMCRSLTQYSCSCLTGMKGMQAMAWIGRLAVRFRYLVIVAWLLVTAFSVYAFPSLGSIVNSDNSSFLPSSAPSRQAATLASP